MNLWHILFAILVLPDGSEHPVLMPFPSERACGDALPLIAAAYQPEFPDSIFTCRATGMISSVFVRPQSRPTN